MQKKKNKMNNGGFMEETTNAGAADNVETIAKQVFDDMQFAHKQEIEKLTQENNLLKKQVNDYSSILKNISCNTTKSNVSSEELVKNLLRGVK